MTVERLENEMSANELDDWMEFYHMEPFGNEEKMNDIRHGVLCSTAVNMVGSKVSPSDFLMYQHESKQKIKVEEMSEEQIKAAQSAIFLMLTTK